MSKSLKKGNSRAADYSRRPEIRSQFPNEAAYLSFLIRDKYCVVGNDENQYAEQWDENHLKLMLILKCCGEQSTAASGEDQEGGKVPTEKQEQWIRHTPLLTFVYEGIKHQIVDYDFAPSIETIGTKHVYMNVSREGNRDIGQLRKAGMIDMIMVTSTDGTECRAYRLSRKGHGFLKDSEDVTEQMRKDVDEFMHAPGFDPNDKNSALLEVFWDQNNGSFEIVNHNKKYARKSTVNVLEDISYVCSPYFPQSSRDNNILIAETDSTALPTNQDIAAETVNICHDTRGDNIRDEAEEILKADDVNILIGEWIPFGPNILAYLNERFGSVEHTSGGIFSNFVDRAPQGTILNRKCEKSICYLNRVIHHNCSRHIKFTSIVCPKTFEKEIVQLNEFGVNANRDGSIVYGLKVESTEDRLLNGISMSHISRLLVDALRDSSKVADNLVTSYQRSLINCLYSGAPEYRQKYTVIMAKSLEPMMLSEKYMDEAEYENEIKQIVGETYSAFDLKDREMIFFGRDGLLIVGKHIPRHEEMLLSYLTLLSRERALRVFFSRSCFFGNVMKAIRGLLVKYDEDPGSLTKIRKLCQTSKQDLLLMDEILTYINESFANFSYCKPLQQDKGSLRLSQLLNIPELLQDLKERTTDLLKNVSAYKEELLALERVCQQHHDFQNEEWHKRRAGSPDAIIDLFQLGQTVSSRLQSTTIILFGIFLFAVVDSGWTVHVTGASDSMVKSYIMTILAVSSESILNLGYLGFWLLLAIIIYFATRVTRSHDRGTLKIDFLVNKFIDLERLELFFSLKKVSRETTSTNHYQRIRLVSWVEKDKSIWLGKTPRFEITYDKKNKYLLHASITIPKNNGVWKEENIQKRLLSDLEHCKVFVDDVEREPWKDEKKSIFERIMLQRKAKSPDGAIVEIGRHMADAEESIKENHTLMTKVNHEIVGTK